MKKEEKINKTVVALISAFLIVKIVNLFMADVAFNRGYRENLAGNWEESAKNIESAIKLNRHQPTYYYELADSYCQIGDIDKCINNANRALQLNPNNSLTLKALIKTFLRVGQIENAVMLGEKLIQLSPTDAEAHYLLQFATQSATQ